MLCIVNIEYHHFHFFLLPVLPEDFTDDPEGDPGGGVAFLGVDLSFFNDPVDGELGGGVAFLVPVPELVDGLWGVF